MISVSNLSVFFGERVLYDNISFAIGERDRIGLAGRNGAGKSTLLKILTGYRVSIDGGNISKPNGSTIGYLHQDMLMPGGKTIMEETMTAFDEVKQLELHLEDLNKQLTEREDYESDEYMNIIHELSEATERLHAIDADSAKINAEKVLKGLGFKEKDFERPTDEFSGGWKMRIELAKMLLTKPEYLFLDEPTNHLDIESIMWLEDFLSDYPGAVVVVSHDKAFLDKVTKRTLELELGKMFDYKANYSKYVELRAERRELLNNAAKNQAKMIEQRERTINRFMAKATKTSMAQSMQKQLDKVERIEIDDEDIAAMNIKFPAAPRSGQVVVEAEKLVKTYGETNILNEIELKLDRGDRVSFVGQNGQGKTTLAKILINRESLTGGELKLGHNVQVGYYAQNQAEALSPNLTLEETMLNAAPPEMRTRTRAILGAFMFSGDDATKKVSVLSGGERARLALACMMLQPFNLLVLDEPTNHLDMISKNVLKEAIMQFDGTIIIVSHDRDFLAGLTNRTIEFRDKKLYEYLGDINYFLEKRQLDNMREVEQKTKSSEPIALSNEPSRNGSQHKAQSSKLNATDKSKFEKSLKISEKKISDLEKEIATMNKRMGESGFYMQSDSAQYISKYEKLKKELETEMEKWEEVAAVLEA